MKEINTLSDLITFTESCRTMNIDIPKNMFIVSPDIIHEAIQYVGHDMNVITFSTGIQIYGVNVIRDFAEVVTID